MKRIAFAALAVLFLASCARRDEWTTFRGSAGDGDVSSTIAPPVGVRWKILLQRRSGDDRFFNQPVVAGNAIFFGSSDGNFYALDLASGFMNWTVRTEGPINSVPCVDDENVYFGSSDGKIYAANRATGKISWAFATEGAVNSTLVRWKDSIVAAADTDAVYVLSPTGELRARISNEYWYNNSFQVYDDRVVFAPGSPEAPLNLAVYDLADERYLWTLDHGQDAYPWFSFPAVSSGGKRLYYSAIGLEDGSGPSGYVGLGFRFFCLDFRTGKPLWMRQSYSRVPDGVAVSEEKLFFEGILLLDYGAPVLWRNRVIFATGDGELRCFDAASGRTVWERGFGRPISSAVSGAGGRLYFGLRPEEGEEGALVCASASSGRELWRVPVTGSILNSPVVTASRIFFGTDEGYFYVLEEVL